MHLVVCFVRLTDFSFGLTALEQSFSGCETPPGCGLKLRPRRSAGFPGCEKLPQDVDSNCVLAAFVRFLGCDHATSDEEQGRCPICRHFFMDMIRVFVPGRSRKEKKDKKKKERRNKRTMNSLSDDLEAIERELACCFEEAQKE